tara:strand:+ start:3817 stop:5985 length:2169 start_codon:yes stop_codon:yes gene_type:complete
MSYRNPRFYKPVDYTSFNRAFTSAFDTQYKNATNYFDKKIEQRELYEKDLFAQADKMREGFGNMEELSEKVQEQLEQTVQDYVKQGLEVEGLDKPGIFGQKIKQKKYTKLDIDKGIANFNAKAQTLSGISDMILKNDLNPNDELNNGSNSYREINALQQAMTANQSNISFNHVKGGDGQEFDFSIEIDNPRYRENEPKEIPDPNNPGEMKPNPHFPKKRKFSATELSQLMGENTKEDRVAIDADKDALVDKIVKTSEGRLNERNADGKAYPGTRTNTDGSVRGVAYHGSTDAEGVVDEMIEELSSKNENNPDETNTLDDIFNNHVNFNDKIRLAEFSEIKGDASTGQLDSSVITNLLNDPDTADYFAMIMDLPKNEIGEQQYLLKKMGITDAQMKGALLTVDAAKDRLTRRYLINEAEARGLESKYIEPEKVPASGTGSGSGGGSGDTPPEIDTYSPQQAGEAFTSINAVQQSMSDISGLMDKVGLGKDPSKIPGEYKGGLLGFALENQNMLDPGTLNQIKELRESFTGSTLKYGGTSVAISDFEIDSKGNMKFGFEKGSATEDVYENGVKTGVKEKIDFEKLTDSFNIYDPEDMRNFYSAISPEAGTSSKYTREFASEGFDRNMTQQFINDPNGIDKLADPKYEKWLKFIDERAEMTKDTLGNTVKGAPYGKLQLMNLILQNESYWTDTPGNTTYSPQIAGWVANNQDFIDDQKINGFINK